MQVTIIAEQKETKKTQYKGQSINGILLRFHQRSLVRGVICAYPAYGNLLPPEWDCARTVLCPVCFSDRSLQMPDLKHLPKLRQPASAFCLCRLLMTLSTYLFYHYSSADTHTHTHTHNADRLLRRTASLIVPASMVHSIPSAFPLRNYD